MHPNYDNASKSSLHSAIKAMVLKTYLYCGYRQSKKGKDTKVRGKQNRSTREEKDL